MKENELEIQNNMRVQYGVRNHKVFRGNRPLLCKSCIEKYGYDVNTKTQQYETAEKGVQFIYENNKVFCPMCKRELTVLKDYSQWKKEQEETERIARENIHLIFMDRDWSTGKDYYRLSARVSYDDWKKVSEHFIYITPNSDQDFMYDIMLKGWFTTNPEAVEKALDVKEDLTVSYRLKEQERKEKERKEKLKRKNELSARIISFFSDNGEKPEKTVLDEIEGDVLEPDEYSWNNYGGGYKFIINQNHIWFIRNNGHDGDDWSQNNIVTSGAGAIGWMIKYDDDMDNMIREYCEL